MLICNEGNVKKHKTSRRRLHGTRGRCGYFCSFGNIVVIFVVSPNMVVIFAVFPI